MGAMSGGAAQMPPEQLAAMMQALGVGGAPGAAPAVGAPTAGQPPAVAAPAGVGGAIPGFQSTDPAAVQAAVQQVLAPLQQQDQATLLAAQQAAEQSAMATAAQGMGGSIAAPAPGSVPLGGDPFAGGPPAAPGMAMDPAHMALSPDVLAAFGGPSYGSLESENVAPQNIGPGGEFADALGGA